MDAVTILIREILLTLTEEDAESCGLVPEVQFNSERIRESLYRNEADYIHELWNAIAWNNCSIVDERIKEFRSSGQRTELVPRKTHPYIESIEVARPITGAADTRWVGWIYWYGEEHYDVSSLEWIKSAKILQMKREMREVLVFSPLSN